MVETALTAASARPYDISSVPATATNFTQYEVARRFGGNSRSTARSGVVGYRVVTWAVARTVANAHEMRKRQHAALEGVRLSIGGKTSTPVAFESAEDIRPDEGYFSGATFWTFAL